MRQQNDMSQEIADILNVVTQREEQERVIQIEEKTTQLVVFLLDGAYLAFQGEYIKEIVPVQDICYVPGMPEYLPGVINVRGDIESVLDLRIILGFQPCPLTKHSRVTLGEANGIRSGILVDSVEDVLEIPENQIIQALSGLRAEYDEYVLGEATYHQHELLLLDVAKLFANLLGET